MKKGMALLLAAAMAISLIGCSSSPSASSKAEGQPTQQAESKAESKVESKAKTSDSGKIGNYEATIESARLSKDYEGKKAVVVKYKFTNNSDKATSFATALIGKAFQNGVELETAVPGEDKEYNPDNYMKEIKKGASLEVECPYKLSDDKSKVEVELSEVISMSDEKLEKSFDVSGLK